MAGPIKISILADAAQAVKEVTRFRETSEENVQRVVTTLGDSKVQGSFGRIQEGFDVLDTRMMGFRDTMTGVQDSMAAWNALTMTSEEAAKGVADAQAAYNAAVKQYGENSVQAAEAQTELSKAQTLQGNQQADMLTKLQLLGFGIGDTASAMANFIVPVIAAGAGLTTMGIGAKAAAAGQWLLNSAMLANPITWVVVAVAALVAVLVVAYKRSETFRRVVDGAFRGVTRAARATWSWIKGNWPLLLAVITGPIGLATLWVVRNFDRISAGVRRIPGAIRGAFSGAGTWLRDAGRRIIDGLIGAVQQGFQRVKRKFQELTNLIPDWKGPAARDRDLLKRPADLIMDGFAERLESRFTGVRSSLAGFTGGLATAATSGARNGAGGAAGGGVVLTVNSAGSRLDDLLVEVLRRAIRVQGGNVQAVLGRG